MQKFTQHTGTVAPLLQANIDTDQIIPKQYLKSIRKTGFGVYLFDDWRYLTPGDLSTDISNRAKNQDFILNQIPQASILLAGENFGCGSSREHAPWALLDFGFRAIIAPGFADIFYNNSFKNGLLLIQLDQAAVDQLAEDIQQEHTEKHVQKPDYKLSIDLDKQLITTPDHRQIAFSLDEFRRYALLNGLDEIDITLESAEDIKAYERKWAEQTPWLFQKLHTLRE